MAAASLVKRSRCILRNSGAPPATFLEWGANFDRQDAFGVEGERSGAPAFSVEEHERVYARHEPQYRDERGEIRPCADEDPANLAVRSAPANRL
jgi:hypothetical protein